MKNANTVEREMLALINQERSDRGLNPLQLERNLNQSAEDHSKWMLQVDKFSHTGASNSSATERMVDAGFDLSGSWRTGENIAVQSERGAAGISDDVVQLHNSLMNSPGHRANILNPNFDYIGIGVELGDFDFNSGTYSSVIVTQNFAATGGSVNLDTGGSGNAGAGNSGSGSTSGGTPPAPPATDPASDPNATSGSAKNDVLRGTNADDTLKGLAGNDRLAGRKGDDRLDGGNNNDKLYGGRGEDDLYGGAGNDWLFGGRDNDMLTGGDGADMFVFKPKGARDVVRDFQDDVDLINLRAFKFDTVNDALETASQTGDDIIFYFSRGEVLVVEDTTLAELKDDLLV